MKTLSVNPVTIQFTIGNNEWERINFYAVLTSMESRALTELDKTVLTEKEKEDLTKDWESLVGSFVVYIGHTARKYKGTLVVWTKGEKAELQNCGLHEGNVIAQFERIVRIDPKRKFALTRMQEVNGWSAKLQKEDGFHQTYLLTHKLSEWALLQIQKKIISALSYSEAKDGFMLESVGGKPVRELIKA